MDAGTTPYEEVNDFDRFVQIVFKEKQTVIVDFWADWCGPCKRFAPIFEAAANAHPELCFLKVDTERNRDIMKAAGVRSLPTIGLYHGGELFDVIIGVQTPAKFDKQIKRLKAKSDGKGLLSRLFSK
ncbi:MAG: thioredoxin [Bradymonadia bacterium]|jgi:thioredoxin